MKRRKRSAIAHGGSAVGADGNAAARPQCPSPLIEAPEAESEFADLIAAADTLVRFYGPAKECSVTRETSRELEAYLEAIES